MSSASYHDNGKPHVMATLEVRGKSQNKIASSNEAVYNASTSFTQHLTHLANTFIQSNLLCICQYACSLGIKPISMFDLLFMMCCTVALPLYFNLDEIKHTFNLYSLFMFKEPFNTNAFLEKKRICKI